MRGGTSNAVIFRRQDLPADQSYWDPIFLAVLGSPDPNGRQLDGVGGGISSLSKVCVAGPSARDDADIDYTFAQVPIDDTRVDYSGNCGNISAAIGPFAVEEGMIEIKPHETNASVRLFNTNTSKVIRSSFPVEVSLPVVSGDLAIDGVAGTGAAIRLDFIAPAGSKTGKLLPTGHVVDRLDVAGGPVEVSLVDASNPCVFITAESIGIAGGESPLDLDGKVELLERLEAIRRAAAVAMGLATDPAQTPLSVPKIAAVAPPLTASKLNGEMLSAEDVDLTVRMMSARQPHRAIPVTGALCTAAACRVPGTLPNQMLQASRGNGIRLGHPSGVLLVDATMGTDGLIESASLYRTARRIFEGNVLIRA
jgi:2-methylaconitate isomerase